MKKTIASLMAAVWLPVCSFTHAETVTFSPEVGEQATYWVMSHSHQQGSRRTSVLSQVRVDYQVADASEHLLFTLHTGLMKLFNGESLLIDSQGSNRRQRELFRSGFELELDREQSQIRNVRGLNTEAALHLLKKYKPAILSAIQQGVSAAPGITLGVDATPGASVALPDFHGFPVELEVVRVSDEKVWARLTSDTSMGRVYGELSLSRQTGWVDKLIMVSERDKGGSEAPERGLLLVLPTPELVASARQILQGDLLGRSIPLFAGSTDPADNVTEEHFGDGSVGRLYVSSSYDSSVKLSLPHEAGTCPDGKTLLRNPRAYAADGTLLDVRLVNETLPACEEDEDGARTRLSLYATAPSSEAALERLERLEVDVEHYNARHTTHRIVWPKDRPQTFNLGGLEARITPLQDDSQYEMEVESMPNQFVSWAIGGLEGEFTIQGTTAGPDWLTAEESAVLGLVSELTPSRRLRLLLDEQPYGATLYTVSIDDKPALTRTVSISRN